MIFREAGLWELNNEKLLSSSFLMVALINVFCLPMDNPVWLTCVTLQTSVWTPKQRGYHTHTRERAVLTWVTRTLNYSLQCIPGLRRSGERILLCVILPAFPKVTFPSFKHLTLCIFLHFRDIKRLFINATANTILYCITLFYVLCIVFKNNNWC